MKGMSGDGFPLIVVSIIYFILCSTAQLQAVFLLNYWRTRPTSQWRPSQMLPGVKKQKSNFFEQKIQVRPRGGRLQIGGLPGS